MNKELYSQAWRDEETDTICVKVGIWEDPTNDTDIGRKKGIIIKLTEEQLPYVAEAMPYPIRNLTFPEKKIKQPVYEMGSADPVFFVPGSTDFRVSIDGEKLSVVQAMEFDGNDGQLIFIGHPGSDWIKDLPKGKCHLLVEVASEYGKVETAYDLDIVLDEPYWAMSIDDIITETIVSFTKYGKFSQRRN